MAFPQNPDAALRAIGMSPENLGKTLIVQFVGEDRDKLRWVPDLSVSVDKLRRAFSWLCVNSWPFMDCTRHHELWHTGELAKPFETLLAAYVDSVGSTAGGTPRELVAAASQIPRDHAAVHVSGPADCVDTEGQDPVVADVNLESELAGNQCAAALDGGIDDITPVQLWDAVMKKYKVAQLCDEELARLAVDKDKS